MSSMTINRRVLLVSSDGLISDLLTRLLPAAFEVTRCGTTADAKTLVAETEFGVLFFDENAPEVSTREIYKSLRDGPNVTSSQVVLLDPGQRGEAGSLIDSCHLFACILAPWENNALVLTLERAVEFSAFRRDPSKSASEPEVRATGSAADPALNRAIARAFI